MNIDGDLIKDNDIGFRLEVGSKIKGLILFYKK
jgi:hypothetical protein